MSAVTFPLPLSSPRRDRLALLGRLQDTEGDHARARRRGLNGVTAEALEADKARWSHAGGAIAALARTIAQTCAPSTFCETRTRPGELAARLSESIDDQFDPAVWRIVDAAA